MKWKNTGGSSSVSTSWISSSTCRTAIASVRSDSTIVRPYTVRCRHSQANARVGRSRGARTSRLRPSQQASTAIKKAGSTDSDIRSLAPGATTGSRQYSIWGSRGARQIADCRLQIKMLNLQSAICNLQSPNGHRHHDVQIALGADGLEDAGVLRRLGFDHNLRCLDCIK